MNPFHYCNRGMIAPVLAVALGMSLPQADATVVCGPMLLGATTTTIYVEAECTVDISTPMTVEFGTTTAYGSSASTTTTRATDTRTSLTDTTTPVTYVHVIKLTGLQPNTLYHYKLTGQGTTSADCTFRTLVNPGTPFRWAWSADYRNGASIHGQISDRIRTQHNSPTPPILNITGGDYSGDNAYANWKSQWQTSNELELEKGMATYMTVGNHDESFTKQNLVAFNQQPDSSGTSGYYSFDCGDLHVIVGYAYGPGYGVGSAQYNWIQQDVKASLKPWKIMCFHNPAYTYSVGGHGNDPNFVTITTNLLEPNGVKAVLAGHNHFYQRNLVNGIHHITCGAGGVGLYTPDTTNPATQATAKDNCYLISDVTPTTMNMVVYNNVGTVLDTISLTKLAAPTNLVATPGDALAALAWDSVPGATSYTVNYGTVNGGPYPSTKSVTTNSATVTGLANGSPYYFVVTASDANGPSAPTAQSTATPSNGLPTPPTISDVTDQSIAANSSTAALPFTVGDAETAAADLTVSGTSSNTTLVPNANIVFGGSGANRTVTVTPAASKSGSSTITLTVSDGTMTKSDTFVLTVTPGQVLANQWQSVSDHAGTARALLMPEQTPLIEPRAAGIRRIEVLFSAPITVNPSTAVTVLGGNLAGDINLTTLGITPNVSAVGSVLAITFTKAGNAVALPDAANWRITLNPVGISGDGGLILVDSASTTRAITGLIGDADANGRIAGLDLNRIANSGTFNPANAACLRADVNGDGVIDQADRDATWANRSKRTDIIAPY